MAAKSLRCVVIAYKKCEMDKVLKDEKHMAEWVLPEDDLVWNAYVGIKDPCRLGVKDEVKLCSDASVKVELKSGAKCRACCRYVIVLKIVKHVKPLTETIFETLGNELHFWGGILSFSSVC
ncbi:hypothetical protein DCAR_0624262 [Daucus carota subsp. sativus]|uniref:Uncharacterized protein n=1 Tax=Daucus carota subsp. sativus TaxID=79200 RepID=A0A164VQR3_DAUCS|nr:hypothetical protein DCAR_0624262 [Daucus carota subsp. sativus]